MIHSVKVNKRTNFSSLGTELYRKNKNRGEQNEWSQDC